ncbi:MAG: dodecin family protein [Syntrophomonas sp.]|nr:dodecin family protein [Syntrophomonas sp.]
MQIRVAEIVGESHKDWQDAVSSAIADASKTYTSISGVEVSNWTASVKGNKIVDYKANIKIAYTE